MSDRAIGEILCLAAWVKPADRRIPIAPVDLRRNPQFALPDEARRVTRLYSELETKPVEFPPPMTHAGYVWQRRWTPAVRQAIRQHGPRLSRLIVLNAQVNWSGRRPSIIRVTIDYDLLQQAGRPVGLALRIGPYPGPFPPEGEPTDLLADVAETLVRDAKHGGLSPAELQIDFDCAESKLDGYRVWVEAIRRRIAPVPVTITALPTWLKRPAFARLARAADGFVLQVHSLQRPRGPDHAMTLCDPQAARTAVDEAARLGLPFRVALPTYGYVIGFAEDGRFLGLAAEGPPPSWPPTVDVREARADPAAMARLIQAWRGSRPICLTGIIWYRLPTADDSLNWRWPTLAAVMAGRVPRPQVKAKVRRPETGLVEIDLRNSGLADAPLPPVLTITWHGPPPLAGDPLAGFEWIELDDSAVKLRWPATSRITRLPPDSTVTIAWMRFERDTEVRINVTPTQP